MSTSLKIDFNVTNCDKKIRNKIEECQKLLDSEVRKDSNYYCPHDSGTLQRSGILNTVIGSGKIIWNTPYASSQYYDHPNKSHQHNPNATMQWFETAKANRLKNWEKLVNDCFKRGN